MNTKNKQRAKLALAELEKELEILSKEEMNACKGGGFGTFNSPWTLEEFLHLESLGISLKGYVEGPNGPMYIETLDPVEVVAPSTGNKFERMDIQNRQYGYEKFQASYTQSSGWFGESSYGHGFESGGGGASNSYSTQDPPRTTQYVKGELRSPDTIMFFNKKDAYSHAVKESLDDTGSFTKFDNKIGKEVSGFILEDGSYIVLDPFDNKYDKSHNDQLRTFFNKEGKLFVEYDGKEYAIKSHFHTHPTKSRPGVDGIDVSDADLSTLKQLKVDSICILYNGEEYEVRLGGNYTSKSGIKYSVRKIGKW